MEIIMIVWMYDSNNIKISTKFEISLISKLIARFRQRILR
jgi:transketolase